MSLEDKIVMGALTPATGTEIHGNVFSIGTWSAPTASTVYDESSPAIYSSYELSMYGTFTVSRPPLPPIGRWPEDSFVFEDERGLLHYTRPEARQQADTEQGVEVVSDVSGLTDRELDEALAEAIGYVHRDVGETCGDLCDLLAFEHWHYPDGRLVHPTDTDQLEFATSIDALQAVEARLRDAGWNCDTHWGARDPIEVSVYQDGYAGSELHKRTIETSAPTLARALAEAYYLAALDR